MEKDPIHCCGLKTVKEGSQLLLHSMSSTILLFVNGELTDCRDYITSEMQLHDPEGFMIHEPGSQKKVYWTPSVVIGPHHEWSAE